MCDSRTHAKGGSESRREVIDESPISEMGKAWNALHKQIGHAQKFKKHLQDQKRGRYKEGTVEHYLVEVEIAYVDELLAILNSVKIGAETPMS